MRIHLTVDNVSSYTHTVPFSLFDNPMASSENEILSFNGGAKSTINSLISVNEVSIVERLRSLITALN